MFDDSRAFHKIPYQPTTYKLQDNVFSPHCRAGVMSMGYPPWDQTLARSWQSRLPLNFYSSFLRGNSSSHSDNDPTSFYKRAEHSSVQGNEKFCLSIQNQSRNANSKKGYHNKEQSVGFQERIAIVKNNHNDNDNNNDDVDDVDHIDRRKCPQGKSTNGFSIREILQSKEKCNTPVEKSQFVNENDDNNIISDDNTNSGENKLTELDIDFCTRVGEKDDEQKKHNRRINSSDGDNMQVTAGDDLSEFNSPDVYQPALYMLQGQQLQSAFSQTGSSRMVSGRTGDESFHKLPPSSSTLPFEYNVLAPCPEPIFHADSTTADKSLTYANDSQIHQSSYFAPYQNPPTPPSLLNLDDQISPPLAGMENLSRDRKKFQCPQCRYLTDRKNNLMRHIITMHQDSGKVLECCGIAFQSKASLREHNCVFHSGGYRCQICSRNFCRKALLRRHLTVHSGQKDFFCHLCGYATSHKSNLERHQKVHNKRQHRVHSSNNDNNIYTDNNMYTDNNNMYTASANTNDIGGARSRYSNFANDNIRTIPGIENDEDNNQSLDLFHNGVADFDNSDVIIVDSTETKEHFSPLPITESVLDYSKVQKTPRETKDQNSRLSPFPRSNDSRKRKRRGLFTQRIHSTHDKKSVPLIKLAFDNEDKNDKSLSLDFNENVSGFNTSLSSVPALVNSNEYKQENETIWERKKKEDICGNFGTRNKDEEEHQNKISYSLESLPMSPQVSNIEEDEEKHTPPKKVRICSVLYSCSDCHAAFSNQILLESHACGGGSNPVDYPIPIVMAVSKGRLRISNGLEINSLNTDNGNNKSR